jgi:hypothetical protein
MDDEHKRVFEVLAGMLRYSGALRVFASFDFVPDDQGIERNVSYSVALRVPDRGHYVEEMHDQEAGES